MNTQHYLFDSFLPYQKAITLARWLQGLCSLKRKNSRNGPINENALGRVVFNARSIFPEICLPGHTVSDMAEMLEEDNKLDNMSTEEMEEYMDKKALEIQEMVESGELDMWDDEPKFAKSEDINRFLQTSLELLNTKILKACNKEVSFLERITIEIVALLNSNQIIELRGYEAILLYWDTAKIQYEGEPPYKISFSKQVSEALGLDPIMDPIKLQQLEPLDTRTIKKLKIVEKLVKKSLPQYTEELKQMQNICERN